MKPLGLRTKTFASVGLIIFLVLGSSTIVHIQDLTRDYRQALIWRSEALIQSIVNQIAGLETGNPYPPEQVERLARSCQELYDSQRAQYITYLAVFDVEGRMIAHSEPGPTEADINRPAVQEQLIFKRHATVLDGAIYRTFVPVFGSGQQPYLGSVTIGFTKHAIDEKVQKTIVNAAILFIVLWGLACVVTFFLLQAVVIGPVRKLIEVGERLADGRSVQTIYTTGQGDEIAALGTVFFKIARYVQHITEVASQVAKGRLAGEIQIRSAYDTLGNAVAEMLHYLRHLAAVATRVAAGDFTESFEMRSSEDTFGQVIQTMIAGLQEMIAQLKTSAEQLATTGVNISAQTEQDIALAERVHIVTENMMDAMQEIGASVEEVAQSMKILCASVQETSDSVVMITTSITHIASNAGELTEHSHTTINAMEGAMTSLADVVNSTNVSEQLSQGTIQDALEGQHAFDQVMASMNAIDGTIAISVAAITRFEKRSQDIDTILHVIRDIAEQTSLLALNASIIAAQAGERGRGFAVVADEIKGLAQGVSGSTKDIAKILHTLQQETATVVQTIRDGATSVREGMERTGQAQMTLQKIIESARRSSTVVSEIADALRHVMRTSRDVVSAMEEVSAMTDDFTAATSEQESSTEQINNAIAQINTMTAHIHVATDKQLRGVHQMLEAANDVTALIDQNLESSQQIAETTGILVSQADHLIHAVDRFKLEQPA